jgi:hypothetical protein
MPPKIEQNCSYQQNLRFERKKKADARSARCASAATSSVLSAIISGPSASKSQWPTSSPCRMRSSRGLPEQLDGRFGVINVVLGACRALPLIPRFRSYCCVAPGRRPNRLTRDDARRLALNFAKLLRGPPPISETCCARPMIDAADLRKAPPPIRSVPAISSSPLRLIVLACMSSVPQASTMSDALGAWSYRSRRKRPRRKPWNAAHACIIGRRLSSMLLRR